MQFNLDIKKRIVAVSLFFIPLVTIAGTDIVPLEDGSTDYADNRTPSYYLDISYLATTPVYAYQESSNDCCSSYSGGSIGYSYGVMGAPAIRVPNQYYSNNYYAPAPRYNYGVLGVPGINVPNPYLNSSPSPLPRYTNGVISYPGGSPTNTVQTPAPGLPTYNSSVISSPAVNVPSSYQNAGPGIPGFTSGVYYTAGGSPNYNNNYYNYSQIPSFTSGVMSFGANGQINRSNTNSGYTNYYNNNNYNNGGGFIITSGGSNYNNGPGSFVITSSH